MFKSSKNLMLTGLRTTNVPDQTNFKTDSAAIVAMGALTGMLGLGLAAKKREF